METDTVPNRNLHRPGMPYVLLRAVQKPVSMRMTAPGIAGRRDRQAVLPYAPSKAVRKPVSTSMTAPGIAGSADRQAILPYAPLKAVRKSVSTSMTALITTAGTTVQGMATERATAVKERDSHAE